MESSEIDKWLNSLESESDEYHWLVSFLSLGCCPSCYSETFEMRLKKYYSCTILRVESLEITCLRPDCSEDFSFDISHPS